METDVWRTRLCAEESLTQRYVIAGVAGWNLAVFLLGAMKVAWLSSKLRWPLQFSIAVLVVVGGRQTRRVSAQTETESCQHPLTSCGSGAPPESRNAWNHIRGLFSLCHVSFINPLSCKVGEMEDWSGSALTFVSGGALYSPHRAPLWSNAARRLTGS